MPELSAWYYSSGNPVVFTSASGERTKTIVSADGAIVDFPGIEAWAEQRTRDIFEGKPPERYLDYGIKFNRCSSEMFTVYWTVQPDGRYWADEDGFGMTNDEETVLFTHLDGEGRFTGPFRLHHTGIRYYYYGDDGSASRPVFAYESKLGFTNRREVSIARFCDNYEEAVIPDSIKGEPVTEIKILAFGKCTGVRRIVLPDSIERIGTQAFEDCEALESIRMPAKLCFRTLNSDMFRNCAALKSIVVPEGMTGIGREAFSGCSSLEEIVLPPTVRDYGPSFLRGCTNLRRVTLPAGIGLITPFSVDGGPLSGCLAEIRACAASGRAFVFDADRGQPRGVPLNGPSSARITPPAEAEYALGEGFVLEDRKGALICRASDPAVGSYTFQGAVNDSELIITELAAEPRDLTDEQMTRVMRDRLKDLGMAYISWEDKIEQIGNITYGTCLVKINRDMGYRAAIAVHNRSVLLIMGNVIAAMKHLHPVK